ncbi:folate-binding protein [Pyruvatibacter sp.]|uniref:CAF17-like 4Fe-4S cluster assembly/insertion protein YgfZ n=1 Tax=Pyruvatibacter sp. TaxID=1981328 RepID=UPI003265A569
MSSPHHALLDDRAVLRASGADMYELLQRLVTGNLDQVAPGNGVYSLLLTPQGKFLFDFFMVSDPENEGAMLIDCAKTRVADLQKRLTMYKLRADAAFDNVSAEFQVIAHWGAGASVLDGAPCYPDPRDARLGYRCMVPASDASALLDKSHSTAALAEDYRAFCVSLGVPDGSLDIGADKDFPIESNLDLLNGIDFHKGCFVGQEVASRTHRKGKARKRLVVAALDGDAPEPGSDVLIGEAKVGSIAGSAGSNALALVFTDRVAKARSVEAQAGDSKLTLSVPPYASFSLEGDSA